MARNIKFRVILVTALILLFAVYFQGIAFAAGDTGSGNKVTINVKGADIRDVLSALAFTSDNNIIFAGEPLKVDFKVENSTFDQALDYLLTSYGLDYIKNGKTIIVGTRDKLTNDFFNETSLAKFNLQFIDSDVVAAQIDALGIQVKKVTLESNKKAVWIQGLPRDLSKVRELISMLDKPENAGTKDVSNYSMTSIQMTYITAEQLNDILKKIGLNQGLVIDSDPMTLWFYGKDRDIEEVKKVKNMVDIEKNAKSSSFILKQKDMQYLTTNEVMDILEELNVDVNVVTINRRLKTLWLNGDEKTVELAEYIINKFDTKENVNDNVFFVYYLNNISAKEAEKRLQYLNIEGVKTYTFNFPELTKSILVFCPQDYKLYVLNHIMKLDAILDTIKVPVDYSNVASGYARLRERMELIVSLTGIPSENFTISDNVARDDSYHFVMYLEDTPENVQYVKDIIKRIDNPLLEDSGDN